MNETYEEKNYRLDPFSSILFGAKCARTHKIASFVFNSNKTNFGELLCLNEKKIIFKLHCSAFGYN